MKPSFTSNVTESGSFDLRRVHYDSFETVLQALSVPTLMVAGSHVIELANNAFLNMSSGMDPVGLTFSSIFPNAEELEAQSLLEHVIGQKKHQVREMELEFGGKTIWVRMHLQTVRVGAAQMVLVQFENLTAEKELLTVSKYKKLIDIFPIGIAEFSFTQPLPRSLPADQMFEAIMQARMVDGNAEFAKMHGFMAMKDLPGVMLSSLIPAGGKGRALVEKWVQSFLPLLSFERKEKCSTNPGKHFENTLIFNTNDQMVLGLWWLKRDISEKKRTDQEILKAQKLESLGVLAGGIAHDFNNLLTGILGNISLGLNYSNQSGKALERFQAAIGAADRAKGLTHQLLTFSKGGAPIKATGSLGNLLEGCARFVLSGSKARCRYSISADLWAVEMDDGQISQVVNNLLINAADAMPNGGTVLIRASNVTIRGNEGLPLKKGRYVKASVTDHGCGIKKEIIRKIFDPYFTTKEKGSGLGLSSAYFIIQKHGGLITVRSKTGIGTTFQFFLPAVPFNSTAEGATGQTKIGG